jgi:hypothetical protein
LGAIFDPHYGGSNTVRKLFAVLVLTALGTASLAAQRAWQSEVGIQGGFSRVKPAGTNQNDHVDLFDVPNFNVAPAIPSYPTVFAIIPWQNKLAFEPSFAVSQLQQTTGATLIDLGLRLDYALSPKFYAAAGVTASHINSSGTNQNQLGVTAGAGYRMRLTGSLRGRVEARATFHGKTDNLGPTNVYSLLFGLSASSGGGGTRRATPAAARGSWRQVIGISGGYGQIHAVSGGAGGDITALAFPGYGGGFSAFGSGPIVFSPTMFLILPLGDKLALEPGLDFHRTQQAGPGNVTRASANISGRLNYALHGGWYAAVGVNAHYFKVTATPSFVRPGANVAAGYRFRLANELGGRVELSHIMFKERLTQPRTSAITVTSLMLGVTVALK